jgi:hypothetical protein
MGPRVSNFNIYLPEVCDSWMRYVNAYGAPKQANIDFPDSTNWRHSRYPVADLSDTMYAHNLDYIKEAIRLCTLPYKNKLLNNLDVYLTSYPDLEHCNARADGRGMLFYGRGTPIPKATTHYAAIHELGHVFDYRFFRGRYRRMGHEDGNTPLFHYYRLRNWLKEEKDPDASGGYYWVEDGKEVRWAGDAHLPWHERIVERFAEDFRWLFGGALAKQDHWSLNCDPPGNDVKELMLEVIRADM